MVVRSRLREATGSIAGVEQRKAAGAVGRLHHAGREAALADGRRLLVAGDAEDRDRGAEQVRRRDAESAAQSRTCGQQRRRARGRDRTGRRPIRRVRISSSKVRAALVASVACTVPPVSRHSRKVSTVPKASRPGSARPRARRDVVEQPGDLGGGEVGIEHQPGLVGDGRSRARPRRSVAQASAVRRSCQTIALWMGLPVARSQTNDSLALVGDADGGDVAGRDPGLGDRLARGRDGGGPDLLRVVLDPAGRRIDLAKFVLRGRDRRERGVEHDRARRRGALVDREDVAGHSCAPYSAAALVSRFRSSPYLGACSHANFGIEGH